MATLRLVLLTLSFLTLMTKQGCNGEEKDSVNQLTQEITQLKTQLESKNQMLDHRDGHIVAALEQITRTLGSFGDSVDDGLCALSKQMLQVKEEVKNLKADQSVMRNNMDSDTVRDMNTRLDECQSHVEELQKQVNQLNNTVESSKPVDWTKKCKQPNLEQITRHVLAFRRSRNWEPFKGNLEYLLDRSSDAYIQLQDIGNGPADPIYGIGIKGYTELSFLLLCAGLPVDTGDDLGRTILHGAARGGHMDLLTLLLQHGANVNVRSDEGYTPVIEAAYWNNPDVARRLVNAGADITARDDRGRTAMYYARAGGSTVVEWYLQQLEQ